MCYLIHIVLFSQLSIFLFFYSVFLKFIYIAMYTASLQIIFYIGPLTCYSSTDESR